MTDPDFGKVLLLLHGDGAPASTAVVDSSTYHRQITAYGNVVSSTQTSKFGGASIKFDGAGDILVTSASADFSLGTADFTIECFVYFNGVSGWPVFIDFRPTTEGVQPVFYVPGNTGHFVYYANAGNRIVSDTPVPLGTWLHIAVCRANGITRLFFDGVQTGGDFADSYNYTGTIVTIGADRGCTGNFFDGYLDDVCITKGKARYIANSTPPTSPHPDGVGQVAGVVRDDTGAVCARTVRLYDRAAGALIGSTVSDASTGAYAIYTPTLDEVQRVVLDDAVGTLYNDVIDRVIPAA